MAGTVALKPLDQFRSLAIANERPVEIADKADVPIPFSSFDDSIARWVERVGHLHDLTSSFISVEIARGRNRQLTADVFGLDVADESKFIVQKVIFVADEHHDLAAATVQKVSDTFKKFHVI